jgi:hypothetical protein
VTEYRIRCSGKGRKHSMHVYLRDADVIQWHREYLERQPWTSECRPFVVEERSVGMWVRSGQQKMGEVG